MLVTLYETATGRFGPVVSCDSEAELAVHLSDAIHYVEGHFDAKSCVDIATGKVVENTVVELEPLREAAMLRVRHQRDQRLYNGCETPSGVVDTDKADRIGRAATAALTAKLAGEAWSIVWTMHDGSAVTLDADAMLAVNAAVVAHFDAVHSDAVEAKAAIAQASTPDAIGAVVLPG